MDRMGVLLGWVFVFWVGGMVQENALALGEEGRARTLSVRRSPEGDTDVLDREKQLEMLMKENITLKKNLKTTTLKKNYYRYEYSKIKKNCRCDAQNELPTCTKEDMKNFWDYIDIKQQNDELRKENSNLSAHIDYMRRNITSIIVQVIREELGQPVLSSSTQATSSVSSQASMLSDGSIFNPSTASLSASLERDRVDSVEEPQVGPNSKGDKDKISDSSL